MFTEIAYRLACLSGWRRYGLVFVLGLASAAALPPVYALPILLPAFMVLIWMLEEAGGARQIWFTVWVFAGGYFLAGLYWVGIAFLVDAEKFAWALPFAVVGLSFLLALFPATTVLAAWLFARRLDWGSPARILLFAAAWVVAEWLRAWVLTGFPWNQIGVVWGFSDIPLQGAAWAGIWGLSAVTVLAAAAPALFANITEAPRGRAVVIGLAAVLLAGLWGGGALRLAEAPAVGAEVQSGVQLRLVQASIPQKDKWNADKRSENLQEQFDLSTQEGLGDATAVIWPETAIPYFLSNTTDFTSLARPLARETGLFIAGIPRVLYPPDGSDQPPRLFNSLAALDGEGEIQGVFDKFHLVPFGEYAPFRAVLGALKLTVSSSDFTPGPGPKTLALPGLPPVSPLICYEVIFSGEVVDEAGGRPEWLLNLTNDAWFGDSSGPYQHFVNARLRAIEEGLPLVRSANNGISAVTDAYGRVWSRLDLNEVGVLDSPLPRPLEEPPLYVRLQHWWVAIITGVFLLGAFVLRRAF